MYMRKFYPPLWGVVGNIVRGSMLICQTHGEARVAFPSAELGGRCADMPYPNHHEVCGSYENSFVWIDRSEC